MDIKTKLKNVLENFRVPMYVIAEYTGLSRRTLLRVLDGEKVSDATGRAIDDGLRQMAIEFYGLCHMEEETEWED